MYIYRSQLRSVSWYVVVFAALLLLFSGAGCKKKTAGTVPPVLVPSIESQPQPPIPAASQQPSEPATPSTPAGPQNAPATEHVAKPKPKVHKSAPRKPVQPDQPAQAPPAAPKPTAPDNSVQITADVPRAAVQSQKQNTEQLLRNSEGRLGQINRALGDNEKEMLRQARSYIAQSHQALQDGDTERAYNLAVKANLLSAALVK